MICLILCLPRAATLALLEQQSRVRVPRALLLTSPKSAYNGFRRNVVGDSELKVGLGIESVPAERAIAPSEPHERSSGAAHVDFCQFDTRSRRANDDPSQYHRQQVKTLFSRDRCYQLHGTFFWHVANVVSWVAGGNDRVKNECDFEPCVASEQ